MCTRSAKFIAQFFILSFIPFLFFFFFFHLIRIHNTQKYMYLHANSSNILFVENYLWLTVILVCLNTLVPTHESLHCINPQMIYERKASNYLSDQFGLALACKYLMRIHASPRDDFWSSIFDFHPAARSKNGRRI